MLVINQSLRRARSNDDGAVLVTIAIVMLVGFVIASLIAASVLFTIRANATNKGQTQAFIAAESGRDVAMATMASCSATHFTGTDPTYDTTIYPYPDNTGDRPTSSNGLTAGCPTSSTDYVVIKSTGTGTGGSTVTIDSVYPWQVTYSQQPGGVVTYFSGGFTAGVAHYTGDLVLRDGNWACNIDGTLTGDLYVLEGTTSLSNNCVINGDIWSNGNVTSNSQAPKVYGDITTNGYASISSNGGALIDGSISAKGSTQASVTGSLTSRNSITVGTTWTARPARVRRTARPTRSSTPRSPG
ncbi:hypothetical protein RS82_02090 [Microbacterium trichothecenolyticum]|uniref:Type 4 fimbrial biogenesis protein PilX N-terminal domain-containing protein n=1 Tax=Microbacterium trichothecenolyticum TaxID=69370 RepID=A0A0M2HEA5_MICTR|nr:hypothetical protein RS82_02090 [Microbacterium trichothecenolyticum]